MPTNDKTKELTPETKLTIIIDTVRLNETELAEYCRTKGLYPEQIARWVFEFATPNWGKCYIYIELLPEPEMQSDENDLWMVNSRTIVGYDKNNAEIIDYDIPAIEEIDMRNLFFKLDEECAKLDERWTTCRIKVTADGTFDFNFGYELPPHLTGSAEDLLYHPDYESF